ncbi:MAG: ATP-dependent DNA helicase [Candidatus Altiarchaeota archaeon]|nr:ATP-dependent DNA helicase [Candidatus Altiarchaeota archaeon]
MDIFPFARVRAGQKEFLGDVSSALVDGRHLVAHAPTGIGKTVAVAAPSLSHALERGKTVYFLAPKHTQHTIVVDTLKKIRERKGASFVAVDIIGKQWTCPHKTEDLDNREFNEFCRTLKKDERCEYYNNVHKKKLSKDAKEAVGRIKDAPMHAGEVRDMCGGLGLCPYEVSIEAGKGANFVICDFFHVFSPKVRGAFLSKLNKTLEDAILIVDEAHNLPDRIRSILSLNLSGYTLKRAAKEAAFLDYGILAESFGGLSRVLKGFGRGVKPYGEVFVVKEEFIAKVAQETGMGCRELADMSADLAQDILSIPGRHRSHAKTVSSFLSNWVEADKGYARIYAKEKNPRLSLKCLDPSVSSKEIFKDCHSAIMMSGTLLPVKMYSGVLGLESARTVEREYRSPFPKQNRLSLIVPGVTTKYSERSGYMYRKYAKIAAEILREVPGNAAVFFPSYQILESVGKELGECGLPKDLFFERQDMDKDDRKQLYKSLADSVTGKGAVLLGVQAGSLSEGVDYANNLLDCVIIIGLPLETPKLETRALIEYYDFVFERGWDYGYIYPAMNRVLQAAGRCIRSGTDRGAIVLMDERFRWKNYSKCFPLDADYVVSETPGKYVKRFFSQARLI